jgi:hypothetical protein
MYVKKREKVSFSVKNFPLKFGWLVTNAYLCIRFWGLRPDERQEKAFFGRFT